jgi:hypothetical protein
VAVVVLIKEDKVVEVMVAAVVLSGNVTIVVAPGIWRIIVEISMRDLLMPTKFLMTIMLLLCIRHLPIFLQHLALVLMMTSLLTSTSAFEEKGTSTSLKMVRPTCSF